MDRKNGTKCNNWKKYLKLWQNYMQNVKTVVAKEY